MSSTTTMTTLELQLKRLSDLAVVPSYQTPQSAGMDLHAAIEEPIDIEPSAIRMIPCGFAMALPSGYEAQVRPRSGLAAKHGITLPNAPGTIDTDYRGEVMVPLINHGRAVFQVTKQMRIAQMVIAPVVQCAVQIVQELDETQRGAGGFGSTGR